MYYSSITIISSILLATRSFVNAASTNDSYPLTTINSQKDFCIFLPPQPGLVVAVNENNGIPFCFNQDAVPNATVFPTDFITTAHYLKTSTYVQITGFFNRTKYDLQETDGGGQYDNHAKGKPVGAQCKGYNYFVNMIEPDLQRFCIRCCQDKDDCNTGRSGYGCLRIVTGDYTDDNNMIGNSTTSSGHSNNHINSVLAELDELPAATDSTNTTDSTDSTDTADSSSNESNSVLDELDDPSTSDSTGSNDTDDTDDSDDSEQSTDNTTEDATENATEEPTSDTTGESTNDDTTATTASEKIANEIQTLQSKLSNQQSIDEVQTQWKTFASQLSQDHPDIATQISQLTNISSALTTSEQLNTFYGLVLTKLQTFENNSTNTNTTATSDPSATLTHTNTQEDLDWLYNQRESHDNQATW
ncbi:hypothetical protein G6F57_011805 [Rhizopus arrhizus]|uniref:Uncharacterized protein n=1 Tax=Rhizopus oryzae TaxID=64495 RepID=A0A9P6WYS0_RHIOR|nr:hypothetical protein G6F23_010418 [Rhizopus arrhizus]KAG1400793.1 hypothetical protein G6F58_010876 [Rhizopus delemar]KAG0754782.1 hypothetical protein G6F24_012258 [Rhizopus arrhizus]KAG0780789.1 hypothetical protein G6F21_011967 [Rhizopus arrhizus]KAG0781582.1 hypothetical protein G6F22_009500 [Rhizopus arrhizus]